MSQDLSHIYPEPVHVEPWTSPAGVDYMIEIRIGSSGKYYACWLDISRDYRMYNWPGKKTIKGAVRSAKSTIRPYEDMMRL